MCSLADTVGLAKGMACEDTAAVAHDKGPDEPTDPRFRMTLADLEKNARVPLDRLVTSSSENRRPADSDLDGQQVDTHWAGA